MRKIDFINFWARNFNTLVVALVKGAIRTAETLFGIRLPGHIFKRLCKIFIATVPHIFYLKLLNS